LHTNGYSLARKLLFDVGNHKVSTELKETGETVGETLLKPHKSYLPQLEKLLNSGKINVLAHITGGGLIENIPRILPENVSVEIGKGTWDELPIFGLMQKLGNVTETEMYRTFNMGIGMTIVCAESDAEQIVFQIKNLGEKCFRIGRIVKGNQEVKIL
jgi:phosphoribosylformylglycinamidine cyclo-ligase